MTSNRDSLPLRGIYAKVKVCCPHMRRAVEKGYVFEHEWLRGQLAPMPDLAIDSDYFAGIPEICFCPWCGKRIEIVPEKEG